MKPAKNCKYKPFLTYSQLSVDYQKTKQTDTRDFQTSYKVIFS